MIMWAIAYKYEEDIWYDFEKGETSHDLSSTCLLPTKGVAEEVIVDILCDDYVPIEIDIRAVNSVGLKLYEFNPPTEWCEDEDDTDY